MHCGEYIYIWIFKIHITTFASAEQPPSPKETTCALQVTPQEEEEGRLVRYEPGTPQIKLPYN